MNNSIGIALLIEKFLSRKERRICFLPKNDPIETTKAFTPTYLRGVIGILNKVPSSRVFQAGQELRVRLASWLNCGICLYHLPLNLATYLLDFSNIYILDRDSPWTEPKMT